MRNGYIPAAHADLAKHIAIEALGHPRFNGRVIEWQRGALLLCPEGDGKTYWYVKAENESAYRTYNAIVSACVLLADVQLS